jgi:lipopolysaccharide export system permease protein
LILQRYLIREILLSFLAVLVLLLLIYASNRFVQYLSEAAAGKIGAEVIATILGLKLIKGMVLMVPLCLYLGVYIAISRMRRDNEMTAMWGAGLGTRFLMQSVSKVALGFVLIVSLLALYVSPWAETRVDEIEAQARKKSDITGISAGTFKEFSQGDRVVYVEGIDQDQARMRNIFLQVREAGHLWVLTAFGASLELDKETGQQYIVFSEGKRYKAVPGRLDYSIVEYKKYGVHLSPNGEDEHKAEIQASPSSALWRAQDPASAAELQWRISMPVTAILLTVLAVLLALSLPQAYGHYSGLATAILIYFTYSNLLGVARSMVKRGDLPVIVGLWWVHILLLTVILSLAFYPAFWRWRARGFRGQRSATPL